MWASLQLGLRRPDSIADDWHGWRQSDTQHQSLGVWLPVRCVFEARSIARLAELVEAQVAVAADPSENFPDGPREEIEL